MLKVNTKKISVEEFAVKYNLLPLYGGGNYGTLVKKNCTMMMDDKQHFVWIQANADWEECDMAFDIDYDLTDLLFDMIKNGDVIKEEERCLK